MALIGQYALGRSLLDRSIYVSFESHYCSKIYILFGSSHLVLDEVVMYNLAGVINKVLQVLNAIH